MENINNIDEQIDEVGMDYVEEDVNEVPKKEGKIKQICKKLKPSGKAARCAGMGILTGVVTAGAAMAFAKLTGREIITVPEGTADMVKDLVSKSAENASNVVETVVNNTDTIA